MLLFGKELFSPMPMNPSQREEELRAALQQSRERLLEQNDVLQQLTATPLVYARVLGFTGSGIIVLHEGAAIELAYPRGIDVDQGDLVKLSMETKQIVDLAFIKLPGQLAIVQQVREDDKMSVVEHDGTEYIVLNGSCNDLENGDRVVLDRSLSIITANLGKGKSRFRFTAETSVSWDDIGGLAQAKGDMIEAIEGPHRYPDLYNYYGKRPIKGVLLSGPPGCGKTMLGKATATSLASLRGNQDSSGFLYIRGPEILTKYVGEAEATVRQIFAHARWHNEEYGYPAVVFIDEADAILGRRGSGISSDIERHLVPMFLTEMDGLQASGALVILATNRPDVLDPAAVRDGRIDRKIRVGRPTRGSAIEIFNRALKRVPIAAGCSHEEAARVATEQLFSTELVLYDVELSSGETIPFTLSGLCSGAMIAGIVDQATSLAIKRDIAQQAARSPLHQRGLRKADLSTAIARVLQQNYGLNHQDELEEFVEGSPHNVVHIQRRPQIPNN